MKKKCIIIRRGNLRELFGKPIECWPQGSAMRNIFCFKDRIQALDNWSFYQYESTSYLAFSAFQKSVQSKLKHCSLALKLSLFLRPMWQSKLWWELTLSKIQSYCFNLLLWKQIRTRVDYITF